jgi:hypothetical protein
LAEAKLPWAKLSLQSKLPCSSSSDRKARQMLSQTYSCSQRDSRRQQVLKRTRARLLLLPPAPPDPQSVVAKPKKEV